MRAADNWKDYELIDASDGLRLERWGKVVLVRPDPQVLWKTEHHTDLWEKAHAVYHRSSSGGGSWEQRRPVPEKWKIAYGDLSLIVSPTGFKHTGVFPEQGVNWDYYRQVIAQANRPVRVLNLFGYTGGATLACAAAGASVCHVDASKGMVAWGKDNAQASGLGDKPIRWIVDDCAKFVAREQRRGSFYEGIIMDPPSYGRGPGGEVWKLEECIDGLIEQCAAVLSEKPLFFAVNSYTAGISPSVMQYILQERIVPRFGGHVTCDEIGLPVTSTGGVLPCGSTAIWSAT
ncbi:MAG: class I SAM-dependent methyltransferase [Oscillospiraceae bacterium]|nr:class I SAM-dependent methyltransferase [Oscillospiraceae bacterium]